MYHVCSVCDHFRSVFKMYSTTGYIIELKFILENIFQNLSAKRSLVFVLKRQRFSETFPAFIFTWHVLGLCPRKLFLNYFFYLCVGLLSQKVNLKPMLWSQWFGCLFQKKFNKSSPSAVILNSNKPVYPPVQDKVNTQSQITLNF